MLLPFAALVALAFLARGWRRGAAVWLLAVAATLATMLVLKLAAIGCGTGLSPSGHTAAATAIYGGLTMLLLRRALAPVPALLLGALPAALLIGASRVALGLHAPVEVAAGALVGLSGAALLLLAGPPPRGRRAGVGAALLAIPLLALLHGRQADAEPRIAWLAHHLWPFSACHRT